MQIVILGGGGFLGQKLAAQLVKNKTILVNGTMGPISKIILVDKFWPSSRLEDDLIECMDGDITEDLVMEHIIRSKPDVLFHLAAVVSGEAEKNFELGMSVNLHANLKMMELIRHHQHRPVLVFASSCAAFGGDVKRVVDDYTAPMPRSSYGAQKVITELLINDYSRKGWVYGRVLRLPTIAVRPGKPNAATSSFVSSIIREPLQGLPAVCPVSDDVPVWILSPRAVVYNFIHAASLTNESIGADRIINLPGNTVVLKDLISAMDHLAGKQVSSLIDWKPDAFIQSIVLTWPPYFRTELADRLGFRKDSNVQEIITNFMEEELNKS